MNTAVPLDLESIKARERAATPGPWYLLGPPWARDVAEVQAGDSDPHLATPIADFDLAWHPQYADEDPPNRFNDAEFVAHARTDVSALVAEVERLRAIEQAAPTVEHLRELVRWLNVIDKFVSMVDPNYTLPRDEMQRDITALADVLESARDGEIAGVPR